MKHRRQKAEFIKFEVPAPGIKECIFSVLALAVILRWNILIEDKSFVEPVKMFYLAIVGLLIVSAVGAFIRRWWLYVPSLCGVFVFAGLYMYRCNWWLIYNVADATDNVAIFLLIIFAVLVPGWLIALIYIPERMRAAKIVGLACPVFCVYLIHHYIPIYGAVEGFWQSVFMIPFSVFIASAILSLGLFFYALFMKHDPYRCDYWTYAPCALKGYYSSEFYKQTRIPKKLVKDYGKKRSTESSGNYGEYDAYYWLNRTLPGKKKFIFGLVIPEADGGFQEIDVVCFWRNKIILCEAKSYSGTVLCDDNSPYWTSVRQNGKTEFANPALQNWQHRVALSAFLDRNGLLKSNMIVSMEYFTQKYARLEPVNTRHDVRFNDIPSHLVILKTIKNDFVRKLMESDLSSPSCEETNAAFEALNSLKKYSKEELLQMCNLRSASSMYRSESRVQTYYLDEANKCMYRKNKLYTEVLIIGPTGGMWHYAGESDKMSLPNSAVPVKDPEYAYSKLCTVGVARFSAEMNGKPLNISEISKNHPIKLDFHKDPEENNH